ncbi:transmembrane protein 44 isoform X6 [Macaca fascicularis]|uniref:transmembrane protein 44 isoform X6 n=1 Tax=Macaca fascicularis TaxID=9541 RepID=UPI003D158158
MGEAPSPAPALWDWDYLDRCFARHRVCISFGLWICASSCWIAAHVLLLYLRCAKKSRQDQSALCVACCLLTSLCDTVGAVLARQLTIQVFTGAYLAAVDLVNFMFILFPVCGSKFKSNSDREARERKRRRQLRASVFALALPLSLGPCWALWVAAPKASATIRGPQRRLLASLLQENTEILGYLLGSIAAFGSWASRIPPLSRIIIFLSCVMKSKMRQALGFATEARESPDTQALLTCAEKEEENQEARNEDKNLDWVPLTTLSHCKSLRTMTAISRYMELTIEPVQQNRVRTHPPEGLFRQDPDASHQAPLPTLGSHFNVTNRIQTIAERQAAVPPGCQVMDRRALQMRCCRSPHRTLPFRSSGPECLPAAPLRSPPSTPTWSGTLKM